MFPPLFETVKGVSGVKAIFGASPRVYPQGKSPPKDSPLYRVPYAVFQVVGGSPDNYLGDLPDMDGFTTQVDVYATTEAEAAAGARALRDAIEPVAYVVAWRGQLEDRDTNLERYSFDVDWMTPR